MSPVRSPSATERIRWLILAMGRTTRLTMNTVVNRLSVTTSIIELSAT